MNTFPHQLDAGLTMEKLVYEWLLCSGHRAHLLGKHEKVGGRGGPRVGNMVAPDIQVLSPDVDYWNVYPDARLVWLEVKSKDRAVWWGKGHCWRTGIDLTAFESCRAVDSREEPVVLCFVHRNEEPSGCDIARGAKPPAPTGLHTIGFRKFSGHCESTWMGNMPGVVVDVDLCKRRASCAELGL